MKLWLLRPVEPWKPWFDKCFGMVVRAESEETARRLASEDAGDEGLAVWLDGAQTTCEELLPDGPAAIVIRDVWSA